MLVSLVKRQSVRLRLALREQDVALSLGHVQQLVAAAYGHDSYQALRETPYAAPAPVYDPPALAEVMSIRARELGLQVDVARLTPAVASALLLSPDQTLELVREALPVRLRHLVVDGPHHVPLRQAEDDRITPEQWATHLTFSEMEEFWDQWPDGDELDWQFRTLTGAGISLMTLPTEGLLTVIPAQATWIPVSGWSSALLTGAPHNVHASLELLLRAVYAQGRRIRLLQPKVSRGWLPILQWAARPLVWEEVLTAGAKVTAQQLAETPPGHLVVVRGVALDAPDVLAAAQGQGRQVLLLLDTPALIEQFGSVEVDLRIHQERHRGPGEPVGEHHLHDT
ncbi:hypothetical protein [Deinococcus aestuarii]|uniref:hypothetical protein n=1 Tax=Deinococcus aestuarii TaxID=2774531 RepID=UPI001C0CD1CA|nr:hypothetical protein [Deinococcus aestuarii]